MWAPKFRDTWLNIIDAKDDFFIIEDCIVDYGSGIIIKNGQIIWDAINEYLIWHKLWITVEPEWSNRITRFNLIAKRMVEIEELVKQRLSERIEDVKSIDDGLTLHLLHPFNRFVYGHLYDTFQKLYVVTNEKLKIDSVILSRGSEVIDFNTHCDVFFDQNVKRYTDESLGFVKVKKLLFINPVSHPTNFTPESFNFIRNKYFEYFNIEEYSPSKKLFFTRRPNETKRYISNSEEIEKILQDNGIEVLSGKEPLKKIINLVHQSSHIAGIHGALFMNNIFSNENTSFLEFCPEKRNTRTFHDQFKTCKSYVHKLIECDDEFNVNMDVDQLLEFYKS